MSQRRGWVFSLFSIIVVAFAVMILMAVFTFFTKITSTQVTYTVKVVMDISDNGRKLLILMNSQNSTIGLKNIELLGASLAANFDEELFKVVTQSVRNIESGYFGIGDKTLMGTRPEKAFDTEIPVPGAGKSGQVKGRVSLG